MNADPKVILSPYHKIFYNEWKLNPNSSNYNIVFDQTIKNLNFERLRRALLRLIEDYFILNSHVLEEEQQAFWVKNDYIRDTEIFNKDVTHTMILQYVSLPFNLESEPLYRFAITVNNDNTYRLILVFHHIILDGNSFKDLIGKISLYYNLPEYRNTLSIYEQITQLNITTKQLYKELSTKLVFNEEFWQGCFLNAEAIDLRFLKSHSLPIKNANLIRELRFTFGHNTIIDLEYIKEKYGLSSFLYSQLIFAILLYKYTSQKKVSISYPLAIKEHLKLMYGSGININILTYVLSSQAKISDLIRNLILNIKSINNNNSKHYRYPINQIIAKHDKKLLDIFFAQTDLRDKQFSFEDAEVISVNSEFYIDHIAKLVFEEELAEDSINFRVKYNIQEVDKNILNNFITHYISLYQSILSDLKRDISYKNIAQYSILSQEEIYLISNKWNDTCISYDSNKKIHELFEEQVLKNPNKKALIYEDISLTYEELNNKSNQLANYLKKQSSYIQDSLIALFLERNEYMIISILGVLKAGYAYVPLDTSYPIERIRYILEDTKAKIILNNEAYNEKLNNILNSSVPNSSILELNEKINQQLDCITIPIDNKIIQNILSQEDICNLEGEVRFGSLAYVIYTSGTTGNPKGVMIEHKSVVNLILHMIISLNLDENSNIAQFSNYVFDASVYEIFPCLSTSGTLHILADYIRQDPNKLLGYYKQHQITSTFLPTILLKELILELEQTYLRSVYTGGESLVGLKHLPKNINIINQYGLTETTVCATEMKIDNLQDIYIGKPIQNVIAYVLNDALEIMPIGSIGELYIGGVCLAKGYFNSPQLTEERFLLNPFNTDERIYKTGDLVRRLPDGNLEYIGRNDTQVKIRGYRVELSEIESKLVGYDGIKQAFVTTRDYIDNSIGDKYLIAYYIADYKVDEAEILAYLATHLPYYMLPNAFLHVDKLPLNLSGKVDKDSLPLLYIDDTHYKAPNSQLQQIIVEVWSEVLHIPKEKIGITNSFFKLGGNSLLIIKLKNQLTRIDELKNITIADLFKFHTIEQLTNFVQSSKNDTMDTIVSVSPSNLSHNDFDIAIIGASGAFSGCDNLTEYWDLIQNGKEGIEHFSINKCRELEIEETILQDESYVPSSGHLSNIDCFDNSFWSLAPNEARSLDPQIRKFVEHCWYILEDAGYLNNRHKLNIGIFAGSSNSNYLKLSSVDNRSIGARGISYLSAKDALTTRASYLLGLVGIASNINTACSTSLVSVVEACKQLVAGYCDMAIAGGVALLLPDEIGHIYQDGLIFSKDGHCRVFDKDSTGIVNGSGVGAVLLKRLPEAIKDKDNIIAIIKGYAVNNDGDRKINYTAPSVIGQKECIINAQAMANISSNEISYIECHGTGTRLGDPIEIQALIEAFKYNEDHSKPRIKCMLGSVKANIGHADSAAGIAGLLKVCKMLEHKVIPKQINYSILNPEIKLDTSCFDIPQEVQRWHVSNKAPRIAGVSSFGIGGTNAHIIIGEYIPSQELQSSLSCRVKKVRNCVLPLSAKSKLSLQIYKEKFIDYLLNTPSKIEDIAFTLQTTRENFEHRLCINVSSINEAVEKLKTANIVKQATRSTQHNLIFCFPGQGNQYYNMSYNLYKNDKDYRDILDKCINLVSKYIGINFKKALFPVAFEDKIEFDINQTLWAQPALFIVSYAIAQLLERMSIQATSYIGHSIGELVAATLAGVFNLEDAIRLVVLRSKLMQSMPAGSMLSVQADHNAIYPLLENNTCEISVINSPKNCIVSGNIESINVLKQKLDNLGVSCIILNVSHAYHSTLMEEASQQFYLAFKGINLNKPERPFISNITGRFITDDEATSPEYWSRHIRCPVLFHEGLQTLFNEYPDAMFVEVGVGKSSISFVKQSNINNLNVGTIQLFNSSKDNEVSPIDICFKEELLCKLWLHGFPINFNDYSKFNPHLRKVKLPNYQFESKSLWLKKISQNGVLFNNKIQSEAAKNAEAMLRERIIELNQPEKYYEVAEAFLEVLGIDKISIHDDFFSLGGDSLMAISLATKLQRNFKINVADIFTLRTIANIAETAPFVRGNLKNRLEQIKLMYLNNNFSNTEHTSFKDLKYLKEANNLSFKPLLKNIKNVLLTGGTGHLGCNILEKLLTRTPYTVYLIIRASSLEEAYNKINVKFKHYFNIGLEEYNNRIVVLKGDIEKATLGLELHQYHSLIANVDSVIHSAALVRHYGEYDKFSSANIQATINILEFTKCTRNKDIHYISTIAVLKDGIIPNYKNYTFSEEDDASMLVERGIYSQTKYESELLLNKYRKEYGLACNIYRAGNIAMHSEAYRHQMNIEDNAFFVMIKTLTDFGIIADEISMVEVSPVNEVALATVMIFDKLELSNQTYHLLNPNICDLKLIFNSFNLGIKSISISSFIDELSRKLEDQLYGKEVELFMLHQLWLRETNIDKITNIRILQQKTDAVLAQLGFKWSKVSAEMFSDLIKLCSKGNNNVK